MSDSTPVDVAIVIPVFQGQHSLEPLIAEIAPLAKVGLTPGGRAYRISEVILVHDGARDDSAGTMARLGAGYDFVHPVWLSRNYGQHPATLAGMASTVSSWVATLDEDGQQDPRDIGSLLDAALANGGLLVYASPGNSPPHGVLRNAASRLTKWAAKGLLGSQALGHFSSFRLVRGDIARAVAAYCGPNVYLDVALAWVVPEALHCSVRLRGERGRPSGYNLRRLLAHFWRLVLTSGTRPLRLVVLLGLASIAASIGISGWVLYRNFVHQVPVPGWTSMIVFLCLFSGLVLFSLGIIAEYLGIAVSMAMGRPPYVIVAKPPTRVEKTC